MKIAFLTIFAAALLSASVGASESTGVDGIRLGILNTVGNETSEDKEALQKPLLPSRMEQKCSVQFFLTTPGGAVFFYQHNSKILL